MTTAEKLSKIQIEFKAKKSRYNSFGKYNFRSAEDILEALKPINEKYRVYFTVNEKYIHTDNLPIIETTASMIDMDDNNARIDMCHAAMLAQRQRSNTGIAEQVHRLGLSRLAQLFPHPIPHRGHIREKLQMPERRRLRREGHFVPAHRPAILWQ